MVSHARIIDRRKNFLLISMARMYFPDKNKEKKRGGGIYSNHYLFFFVMGHGPVDSKGPEGPRAIAPYFYSCFIDFLINTILRKVIEYSDHFVIAFIVLV